MRYLTLLAFALASLMACRSAQPAATATPAVTTAKASAFDPTGKWKITGLNITKGPPELTPEIKEAFTKETLKVGVFTFKEDSTYLSLGAEGEETGRWLAMAATQTIFLYKVQGGVDTLLVTKLTSSHLDYTLRSSEGAEADITLSAVK